jgi:acetolactate synthase-1/2/3 large subunit
MNGAESLAHTLVNGGVKVCFTNPGTSEMHFVSALDRIEGIRCVLGLFEGVVTGAADGYFRMTGKPAATLLHLGPGLANGLANLHNARKARSGIVNIVGDHATYHLKLDAPLTSDITAIAGTMSDWVHSSQTSADVAADAAAAIAQANTNPGRIATLILPADTAWGEARGPAAALQNPKARRANVDSAKKAASALREVGSALLLSGAALRGRALELAGRISAATGCRLLCENLNARLERGAGRVKLERIPYAVDLATSALKDIRQLVLVGAKAPVAFFAYPDKPSILTAEGTKIVTLAKAEDDLTAALEDLAASLDATNTLPNYVEERIQTSRLEGPISHEGIAIVLANLLPEQSIVVDESITTGRRFSTHLVGAKPHDWLNSMGGSIGFGLPLAVGAAIGAPERKVIALEGDGSAMYTLQSLWTMARENLDVLVVVFANHAYQILQGEYATVGAGKLGQRAKDMLTLDRPFLDWQALARGHGIESARANDLGEFAAGLRKAFSERGPFLLEVNLAA